MTQILMVLDDRELSSMLQLKLAQKYGVEVISRNSFTEATSLIEILPGIEIILCKDFIGKDPFASRMCEFLSSKKEEDSREINLIVIGDSIAVCSKAVNVGKNTPSQKIIDYIGFLLGKEEKNVLQEETQADEAETEEGENEKTTVFRIQDLKKSAEPAAAPVEEVAEVAEIEEEKIPVIQYHPMNVIYFMNLQDVVFDFSVYSRIKKADDFEYHKKFSSNSKITRAEIGRVLIRSGRELYISEDESKKASAFLNEIFLQRFNTPNMSWSERMKLNSDSFEILLDLFKNSSFDKHNVKIIKELIKSIDMLVKAPDSMVIFLEGLNSSKLSFGYIHSYFTFYLLMQIVDHFSWSKDQSKNKLLYLSLFHDLTLHSDRLIKLHHNYLQESKNLTEEEKQIMLTHAKDAANVLESIVKAPVELTALIREHHGLKSGKGFIESLSIAITPTSMAFIVIEDFVTQYLGTLEKMEGDKAQGLGKPQLEAIFTQLKDKYDQLTYLDVLTELQKFFKITV